VGGGGCGGGGGDGGFAQVEDGSEADGRVVEGYEPNTEDLEDGCVEDEVCFVECWFPQLVIALFSGPPNHIQAKTYQHSAPYNQSSDS